MEGLSIGTLLLLVAMGAVSGICKGLQAQTLAKRAVDEELKKRQLTG